MKKILLAGASTYGVRNMGDDAMLYNFTQTFHRKIDCEITFLARHPKLEYDKLYGIKSIKNYEFDCRKLSIGKFFYGFNPGDPYTHLKRIKRAIEESDLIVIGGNSFMEVAKNQYLRGVATYAALLATFAKFFNKPYVLYGVAGHPINIDSTKEMARFLCENAELVTVREQFYKDILINAGVKVKNVKVFGDPAFGVDPVKDASIGQKVLNNEGIRFKNPNVIGIGFRHMYWVWDKKQFDIYSQKMAQLCDFLIDKYNADLLYIPNCTYNIDNPFADDRNTAGFVIDRMKNKNHVHLVKKELNLIETMSLYSRIDMLVSNRRHSCIFSALNGKPMLAMSTGHHWQFQPFMDDLGLGKYAVSFTELSLPELKSRVNEVWSKRPEIASIIGRSVPKLRKKTQGQIDEFIKIMNRAKKNG